MPLTNLNSVIIQLEVIQSQCFNEAYVNYISEEKTLRMVDHYHKIQGALSILNSIK